MKTEQLSSPTPFFLDTPVGRLFAVYHAPSVGGALRGNVLIVPPFNEEMNRCRSMVTLMAQAYAGIGMGTLVLDLFGTGESNGKYVDARWSIWLENIRSAVAWLDREAGGCMALHGIRLGVPLALDAVAQGIAVPRVVAWQPVLEGKLYFTQFLRIRLAANMDRTELPKETTTTMRARLTAGDNVEVAGYEIHSELASAIDQISLKTAPPRGTAHIGWFEKANGDDLVLPENVSAVINSWREGGSRVEGIVFEGPAFWALHDRFLAPDLLQKTVAWVDGARERM